MLGAEDVKKLQIESPQITQEVKETVPSSNAVLDNVLLHAQVGQQLGLATLESERYSNEINKIVEWAKANGAKSMDDILYEIRYLSNMLGNNPMEKKIKTVARYVYLSSEKQKINTEMERLKNYE